MQAATEGDNCGLDPGCAVHSPLLPIVPALNCLQARINQGETNWFGVFVALGEINCINDMLYYLIWIF